MKKTVSAVICVLILLSGLPCAAFASNIPSVGARSSVLINGDDRTVIFSHNCNEKLPMASTTKIMTALVALEKCPLDEKISVDERSVGVEGSSVYLRCGEVMSLRELLFALLLQSANDAAAAIAFHIGGSIEDFARLMNEKAQSLGLLNTHFANPHGLDDENHYTTAFELAVIASEALKNPEFRKIVSTVKAEIPKGDEKRYLVNHNRLLREYDGCIGVKTGFTKRCGRCLVSAAERDGLTLIAVTLSDPDDWNDHKKMLDFGFESYECLTLTGKTGICLEMPVADGKGGTVKVCSKPHMKVSLPRCDGAVSVRTEMPKFLYEPLTDGQAVGRIVFMKNGKIIGESELCICKNENSTRKSIDKE